MYAIHIYLLYTTHMLTPTPIMYMLPFPGAQYFASSRRETLSECPVAEGTALETEAAAVKAARERRARRQRRSDRTTRDLETEYSY